MIVVLDASAAIEILLKRERNTIFRDVMNSAEKIITSDFFMIEVANVLRKYYRGNYIDKNQCFQLLELAQTMINEYVPISQDYEEALSEAIRLEYSVYDMLYFILAKRYEATLLTCDGPLNRIADKEGITITTGR
jgi:predicted nucleic acid-binding protein